MVQALIELTGDWGERFRAAGTALEQHFLAPASRSSLCPIFPAYTRRQKIPYAHV